jgi:ATP-dependent Clp protease ATP-binding subunit ClpX
VKQYQKLFVLEGVELEFEENALKSVVDKAMERGTGARALRSIIEAVMLDVMYHLPSRSNVSKCIITKDTILKAKDPIYLYEERKSA